MVAAAGIPAVLYLSFVFHYAVNVPYLDDWNLIPVVNLAVHGHLTMGALWSEYVELRLFVVRLIFVAFGSLDHLNLKSIMLFSAVVLIASFVLLLLLFRSYLGRRLTFFPVLSLGVLWFSLADVQNALWSGQLAWFLGVFFVVATAYLLLVPNHHRKLYFGLGVLAAVAASLSILQGFTAWPLGLICLLWTGFRARRTYYETTIWVLSALGTTAVYLYGFTYGTGACVLEGGQKETCSLTYGVHHPDRLARIFVLLVGNVTPANVWQIEPRYLRAQEVLGVVICLAAGFVVVQSIRERRLQPNPLPLLLIAFAMLCDLMTAISHLGEGILLGAGGNRFIMPNLLLLVGIVVYAWGHPPNLGETEKFIGWQGWLKRLGFGTLVAFLVVQCVLTTKFGISAGQVSRARNERAARIVVNLDRIPGQLQSCYEVYAFGFAKMQLPLALYDRSLAVADRLSVFEPSAARKYRAEGPPVVAQCDQSSTAIPTLPGVPRKVAAVPFGNGRVKVIWEAPASDGGSAIRNYVVTPFLGAVAQPARTLYATRTAAVVSGLHDGTSYRFEVAARNVVGTGPASSETGPITIGAPGQPGKVIANKVASGSLKVTFAAPSFGRAANVSYTATCTSTNGGVTKTKNGKTRPITVTGLSQRKAYRCTVKATNSRGTGPRSSPSPVVTD